MTKYVTNAHGIKFYIEGASDVDDNGRFKRGKGWFAGLVKGSDELGGVWFETKDAALYAIRDWRG